MVIYGGGVPVPWGRRHWVGINYCHPEVVKLQQQCHMQNTISDLPDKWHLLLSETNNSLNIEIEFEYILNSSNEKVLGVYFDNKINFHTHVDKLCKKQDKSYTRLLEFLNS